LEIISDLSNTPTKGQFIADDKSTPHINEAYVDGKKPVKKRKPRTGYGKSKRIKE
jgi:hypothetical protein